MKDLKDQSIGIKINKKIETKTADDNNVTRFPLDASFQGLIDCLFLLLTKLKMVTKRLKETVIENISYQE